MEIMYTLDDLREIYGVEDDDEDIYVDDKILTVVNVASRLLRLMHYACRELGVSFESSMWLNRKMIDHWDECQRRLVVHVIEAHNAYLSYRRGDGMYGISVWSMGAYFHADRGEVLSIDLDASDDFLLQKIITYLSTH